MTVPRADSKLFIGIDGGGTKTHALLGTVRDGRLHVLGEGRGGPSNPRSVGFHASFAQITRAIDEAFRQGGLPRDSAVDRIVLCLAGAGREEERLQVEAWAIDNRVAKSASLVSEAEAVLAAAQETRSESPRFSGFKDSDSHPQAEVALICGTGSLAWGRQACDSRQSIRCGGWGYLLGDEGSGFWIGQKLLNTACRVADGRNTGAADRALLNAVLEQLKLTSASDLISWCYSDLTSRQRIASLAPLAFLLSQPTTTQIVLEAAIELAQMIATVVKQLNTTQYSLACAGSVVVHQPQFVSAIVQQLVAKELSPLSVTTIDQPALGALRLATV